MNKTLKINKMAKPRFLQNKTVENGKYEIFWQTNYIEHINNELLKSTVKHLTFQEIQAYLPSAVFLDQTTHFLALMRINNRVFQAICFFETIRKHKRCIVKTAFLSTDLKMRELAKNNNV